MNQNGAIGGAIESGAVAQVGEWDDDEITAGSVRGIVVLVDKLDVGDRGAAEAVGRGFPRSQKFLSGSEILKVGIHDGDTGLRRELPQDKRGPGKEASADNSNAPEARHSGEQLSERPFVSAHNPGLETGRSDDQTF